jgi:competence protein ComEA
LPVLLPSARRLTKSPTSSPTTARVDPRRYGRDAFRIPAAADTRRRTMIRTSALALVALLAALAAPATAQQAATPQPAPAAKAEAVINLNTATAADLESLPGIGKSTAQRILEYRQKSGGFKKVEELMNVKGIGEKSFLKIKNRLTVTAAKS